MRRHNPRDLSPTPKRSGTRSTYAGRSRSRSPRKPRRDRYGLEDSDSLSDCRPTKKDFRTLCVRNFSSKLSIDSVQNRLFREFSRYGDMSVTVGYLDGQRAALVVFERNEDAYKAYCAVPSIRLNDRTVEIEVLPDAPPEGKVSDSVTSARPSKAVAEPDAKPSRRYSDEHLVNPILALSNKTSSNSLLGMPTVTPSTIAAQAVSLKLGTPPAHGHFKKDAGYRTDHDQCDRSPICDENSSFSATRTLFVGCLDSDIRESEVVKCFQPFGHIEQVDIKRPSRVGTHAYAFIRYENVDMACYARTAMTGKRIRTTHCKIGYGKPIPSRCLYISGVSNKELLSKLITGLDQVMSCHWFADSTHVTILFDTVDAARDAHSRIQKMGSSASPDCTLHVDYIDPDVFDSLSKAKAVSNAPIDTSQSGSGASSQHRITERNVASGTAADRTSSSSGVTERTTKRPHKHSSLTLQNVVRLKDLDSLLRPDIFTGILELKSRMFPFRCLHVIGDRSLGACLAPPADSHSESIPKSTLKVIRRGLMNPSWMAEATHLIHSALLGHQSRLALLLLLPDFEGYATYQKVQDKSTVPLFYPLAIVIAYLKWKQSMGIVTKLCAELSGKESSVDACSLSLNLFAPSSFCLSLLKEAAPRLGLDLATADNYMVLLVLKP